MSEAKFTKGPWRSRTGNYGGLKTAIVYLSDKGGFDISGCPDCVDNAHLIAAAPEMYEMLGTALLELTAAITEVNKNLKSRISSSDLDEPDWWDMQTCHEIHKLLAKARGE